MSTALWISSQPNFGDDFYLNAQHDSLSAKFEKIYAGYGLSCHDNFQRNDNDEKQKMMLEAFCE